MVKVMMINSQLKAPEAPEGIQMINLLESKPMQSLHDILTGPDLAYSD